MVLKPNPNYQPDQATNMQYPPAGSPLQGPPYDESNQQQNRNQWQGYAPPSNAPYPAQNSPYPSAPNPASRGESSGYYGSSSSQFGYTGPQSPPAPSQQPNYPYGGGYNQQQHYPPPGQYNPHQQYPPPGQGPYGGTEPPTSSLPPYGAYPPHAEQHSASPSNPQPAGAYPPPLVPQTDEERGIMGALAGGAAGGYAGHKLHHGIIGTIGGAYAGHKLEDKWKEHHNKPSPEAPQPIQPPPQQHHGGAQFAGNFSMSSNRISLDRDYDLIAECTAVNGQQRMSSISLNQILTNEDGHFKWVNAGGNFGGSARNVHLVDDGKVLEAELCRCDGSWNHTRIQLDERIGNEDGDLKLV